jgi:hypothetical protein
MLSPFDQLVATEAAVRLEFVYRCQVVILNHAYGPEEYSVANPDEGNDPQEIADRLGKAFVRIYDYAFSDSSQHRKMIAGKVCNTRDLTFEDRALLREIFQTFSEKNYDAQGRLVLTPAQGPGSLKALYGRLRDEVPLHNSSLACGALFVEMGRGLKWRKLFPRGIDFTRGEPVMESDPSRFLDARFHNAFFGADHSPPTSLFINPPESKVEIAGMRFIAKTVQNWRIHLVTQTGHLVDLTDDLRNGIERHIHSGKPLDDLRVDAREARRLSDFVEGHGQSREEQSLREKVQDQIRRMSQSDYVDGLPARDELGQVRILCMDVDFLTGLNIKALPGQEQSDLERLKAFMSEALGIHAFADLVPPGFTANLQALPDGKEREAKRRELSAHVRRLMRKLMVSARSLKDAALENIITIARHHLAAMMPRVYEAADKQFILDEGDGPDGGIKRMKPAPPDSEKRMFMTMGGSASGKSGLRRLAERECDGGRSLVVASLDDARSECERYWFYPATDNHNDDYQSAEQFGNTLRDLITKRALEGGHHIYIDGSGIPYEGRHDKTTRLFKDKGYHISVLAAQAPLFVNDPQRRRALSDQGIAPDDALSRLGARQARELRGLNPKIVVDKHIKFPLASRNAARDHIVDSFMIQDVTSPDNKYTLSYVLTLDPERTENLAKLSGAKLKQALLEENLLPPWVTLPPNGNNEHLYNIKVIRANLGDETYRVEIITDIEQFICMMEKGLLRRDAIGPEALYDYGVHADLEGLFQGTDGKLKTLRDKGVGERVLDQYLPFSEGPGA